MSAVIDLNRANLSDKPINQLVNELIERAVPPGENDRQYLGASSIGSECLRKVQYDWMCDPIFPARIKDIFARGHFEEGLMSSLEWGLYRRLYVELLHSPAARPPRLLVYLHAPLDTIVERIRTRGRPKEKDTAEGYWATLHARYERWIAG